MSYNQPPSVGRARLASLAFLAAAILSTMPAPAAELAGLNVGDQAPGFELKNQAGESVKLERLLQSGPLAVVFYRSADWCPYCQKQLIALQEGLADLKAAGLQLVAISYDSGEVLEQFAKKRGIQFPLLSDPGSATIKAWKLLNADAKGNGEGIPHPMTYVIGRDGVIRAKLGHEAYKDRHTVQELIQSAKTVGQK